MDIAALSLNQCDGQGDKITLFYALKPPNYAVYRTEKRVLVQYSDHPDEAAQQRRSMSALNPLRGEINGLVDGWREPAKRGWLITHHQAALNRRAERYDRRVGDSLTLALEGDVATAAILLSEIKDDIVNERMAWGKLEYLIAAMVMAVVMIVVIVSITAVVTRVNGNDVTHKYPGADLTWAALTGLVGAFFSICTGLRGRTVLPNLQRLANITDAGLRIAVGAIGAVVLMALLDAQVVKIDLGRATLPGCDKGECAASTLIAPALYVLIVGFIAGFSERMLPDLLGKIGTSTPTRSASSAAPRHKGPASSEGGDDATPRSADAAKPIVAD